uniref:Uncharacterized protein n=1 Tax=Acrobeloides nanus TaxID=290746 RepID=A0A914DD77_9BILA
MWEMNGKGKPRKFYWSDVN